MLATRVLTGAIRHMVPAAVAHQHNQAHQAYFSPGSSTQWELAERLRNYLKLFHTSLCNLNFLINSNAASLSYGGGNAG